MMQFVFQILGVLLYWAFSLFEKELKVGCVEGRRRGTGRTWGEEKNMIKYTIQPNFPEVVNRFIFPIVSYNE